MLVLQHGDASRLTADRKLEHGGVPLHLKKIYGSHPNSQFYLIDLAGL